MSDFSDAVQATLAKPAPKAAPAQAPLTLDQATQLARKKNPLLGLPQGQQAEGVSAQLTAKKKLSAPAMHAAVATQEQRGNKANASDAKPVTDFLQHSYNVMETPLSLIGASQLNAERNKTAYPWWQALDATTEGPTMDNARKLVRQGKLGELAQRYSTTSLDANRARAQAGDRGAQYFNQHPTQFGALGFGEEFLNPSNIVGGKLAEVGGSLLKRGVTAAGKAAAHVVTNPAAKRTLNALGEVGTGNRFGEVRQAAADVAQQRGTDPVAAANHADVTARKLVTLPQRATAIGQHISTQVFKGLTKAEHDALIDKIEGTTPKISLTPEREALLNTRVAAYRHFRNQLDNLSVGSGYADPTRLRSGKNYFPRSGYTLNPEDGEEAVQDEVASRSGGSVGERKDTLGKNIHRVHPTRQHAAANAELNPDWSAPDVLEKHVASRVQGAGYEIGAKELRDLGLVDPSRPDFLPSDDVRSVSTYGSPTFKNNRVHSSVASLIQDLAPAQSGSGTLANLGKIGAGAVKIPNRLAAKTQVSNPVYHPLVNVGQNTLMQGLAGNINLAEYLKGLLSKSARHEASEAGADVPYSEHTSPSETFRPWSDLSAKEKALRVAKMPGRAANAVTNRALYKHIQPRMAAAAFKGMKGKLGEDKAALVTRQILGEPENLPPSVDTASQLFMFPHWNAAMARLHIPGLLRNPALYMAPHSAVKARNESRGQSLQSTDWASLIPAIATGVKDPRGNGIDLPIPNPANKVLGIADILGNFATGHGSASQAGRTALNMLNPLLNLSIREGITNLPDYAAGPPDSVRLYDRDNPDLNSPLDTLKALGKRYAPVRGNLTNILGDIGGSVGLEPRSHMSDARSKWEYILDKKARNEGYVSPPGQKDAGKRILAIEPLESKIRSAQAAGKDYFLWGKKQEKVSVKQAQAYVRAAYQKLLRMAPEREGVQP